MLLASKLVDIATIVTLYGAYTNERIVTILSSGRARILISRSFEIASSAASELRLRRPRSELQLTPAVVAAVAQYVAAGL